MKYNLISGTDPNRVYLRWTPTAVIVGIPPYGIPSDRRPTGLLASFLDAYETTTNLRVRSGDLRSWLEKFILMLEVNDKLTFKALSKLSYEYEGIIFVLWGARARRYSPIVDRSKHYLLTDKEGSFREAAEFIGETLDFWRIY